MDEHLELVNRLYEVIMSNLSPVEAWGFYLTNQEFDDEPELRNKLGVLFIASLIDTLEAESRFLPEVAREAETKGFESIAHNANELRKFCVVVGEVLNRFSRDEQLFLTDLRNQWVHTYLANRHRDPLTVKYAAAGKVVAEQMPSDTYHGIIRQFTLSGQALDQTIAPLVARALDQSLRYWAAIGTMQQRKDELYAVMRSGKRITIQI